MKRQRPWWLIALIAAALIMIAGLWFVTNAVRNLEAQQASARANLARAEVIRLALWRMDGWMTPRLAREAARPVDEYASFLSPSGAVNRLLQSVPKGEVLSPSPLLLGTPEWIPLHFEWRTDGTLTSPQVPEGNLLDLAEGQYFKDGVPKERAESLKRLASLIGSANQSFDACVAQAEVSNAATASAWSADVEEKSSGVMAMRAIDGLSGGSKLPLNDYATRVRASNEAQQIEDVQGRGKVASTTSDMLASATGGSAEDTIGPLIPTWLSLDPPELAFVRRIREQGESRVQGFLVDWTQLSASLLSQVSDLANNPQLTPTAAGADRFAPARLASIPVELQGDFIIPLSDTEPASSTPALLFAWAAAVLALSAAAFAAWTSVSFGDRQARFASSVTHELRTPLTTFQLYAEMLRDGMVTDEARRQECLDTLCRESVRLSHLVENVLSLSRLERGAKPNHAPSVLHAEDFSRLIDVITQERAANATCSTTNSLGDASVLVDRDALTQILANLIENAAKYGSANDMEAVIDVRVRIDQGTLEVQVSDQGAGIPRHASNAIWRPFDRAGRESGTQVGLGLGLPVSRALAQGLGGSLELLPPRAGTLGAYFILRIPNALAPATH